MDASRPESRDITSTTLKVLFIGLLISAGFWTIRPFLTPFVWAIIIVVATWPAMLKVQVFLRGKRWLAVTTIVDKSGQIMDWIRSLSTVTIASPPEWLNNVPLVGPWLVGKWQHFA